MALKRGLDVGGSVALIVALAPVFLVVAILVAMGGRPIIYTSERVGRGGQPFACAKFRTMVPDADRVLADLLRTDAQARAAWQRTCKLERDPRVTRIGRILRATSLDELPQLFNVLRGDMSLVGPRPVPSAELFERYGDAATIYMRVRPGLTGPWQISGRSDLDYGDRVALDIGYVNAPSLLNDLRILVLTVPAVLLRRGAR